MTSILSDLRERALFHQSTDTASQALRASSVLKLLLNQDGSTTRIFEKLVGGPITLRVLEQGVVPDLPSQLAGVLPGKRFLRRLVTLGANGHVMLDGISYIAMDVLPAAALKKLELGAAPIGHLLSELWVRREFRSGDEQLFDQLWAAVGDPDPDASRSFVIHTPNEPCMVIAETFRRGVLEVGAG